MSAGVAFVGLLLAPSLARIFAESPIQSSWPSSVRQPLEPVNRASGFDAHAHRSLQTAVERARLAALSDPNAARGAASRGFLGHGNLLIACVKITTYNQIARTPLFRALVVQQLPVYSGEGADAVI